MKLNILVLGNFFDKKNTRKEKLTFFVQRVLLIFFVSAFCLIRDFSEASYHNFFFGIKDSLKINSIYFFSIASLSFFLVIASDFFFLLFILLCLKKIFFDYFFSDLAFSLSIFFVALFVKLVNFNFFLLIKKNVVVFLNYFLLFLIFEILFFQFLFSISEKEKYVSFIGYKETSTINNVARVILIFDELSSDYLDLSFSENQYFLQKGLVKKSGSNTIDAIPRLFVNDDLESVVPCFYQSLCAKNGIFRFEKIKLQRSESTDIIGFWHPYCNIKNLRYCWTATSDELNSPYKPDFLISRGFIRTPFLNAMFPDAGVHGIYSMQNAAGLIEKKSFQAPFWSKGGTLYIHHIIPHPIGYGAKSELKEEYVSNVKSANKFLKLLVSNLSQKFGNQWVLMVTSDHPLRLNHWCRTYKYSSLKCMENYLDSDSVPFYIFSGEELGGVKFKKNKGIFEYSN